VIIPENGKNLIRSLFGIHVFGQKTDELPKRPDHHSLTILKNRFICTSGIADM
jgi:hypothetical protein